MDYATILAKYVGYVETEIEEDLPRDLAILCLNSADEKLWDAVKKGH